MITGDRRGTTMPFEGDTITVRWIEADRWTVAEPLVYRGRRDTFTVPAGFRTDFASVPRVVVWLIPRLGRYTLAAVLHDWLVTEGLRTGAVSPRDADGLFRRVMREQGVPIVRRWLMWTGVRLGALTDPARRRGWWVTAPRVLAITVLAAPVVVPPGLLIAVALLVYGVVERVVSAVTRTPPTDAMSLRT
jgi:Protein of unknown function (DUF1353)